MKLTKKIIDALPFPDPGQGKARFVWDDDVKGFGVRLTANKKTFIV